MLPSVDTNDELEEVVGDEALLRPAAQDLCGQLGLAGARIVRFPEGSLPVYAVGDALVLKLYPAFEAEEAVREARLLALLWGKLPIPTPKLHSADQYKNGWRYVLMSRLPGEDLNEAWPRIPRPDQERVIVEAAEVLAALHALDAAPVVPLIGPPDWTRFIASQRAAAVEQQRSGGLPALWLEQIPDFLRSVPLTTSRRPVLLHTEYMREHLTVDCHDGWRLTGLFDFEPAMVGDPAYDFVSVGLFLTRADPTLLKLFYEAYGHPPFDPRELMAHTLLHVYSDLNWYLRSLPAPPRQTLDALAETWFGTGG
ncbi:aminoglycoside phosphotransferase family protein [Streptomyces sp. DSM 40750]|uniref:aminoglycoside phosphotransferase family protein n=1 Tax=Streptomyces sp. DSM 40750 TaxID=2801030 RepID=UPI00214CA786|nr:aminoglycoside phosphotransferase family protein [Streptomyces sp. DSM 40750]UUU24154.1 aminoglycoside phosphotransferase family protein [Streptomyces sp. DSM 40750]